MLGGRFVGGSGAPALAAAWYTALMSVLMLDVLPTELFATEARHSSALLRAR
jgi:hypothetical protein